MITADGPSITHVYADPTASGASYQITASATDTGGSASYAATPINVTVSAASGPTTLGIAASGDATTVAEGATYTLDLSQTAGDALSDWSINWGDGSSSTVAGNATSIQHVYADAGSAGPWDYSITATGDNDQGTFAAAAPVAIAVSAVAPTLSISGAATVAEGATYTLDLSAIEPAGAQASGMTVASWTINWGDGSTSVVLGNADSAAHVFVTNPVGDATTYTITAAATDDSGTTSAGSQSVTVSPVSTPTFTLSGASTANAGDTYTLTLTQTAGVPLAGWTVNWGDGSTPEQFPAGDTMATYVYAATPTNAPISFTISATATTAQGASVSGSNTVPLTIDPPSPDPTISGDTDVADGSDYTLDLSAGDSANDDVSGWTINWGDGGAPQTISGNPASVTHLFPVGSAASYTINATVTNPYGTWSAASQSVDVDESGPTAADQQSAITINENAVDQVVIGDLTTIFQDAEYPLSDLTFSVDYNSDPDVVTSATIEGNELVVDTVMNTYGMSEVTVEADDPGGMSAATVVPVIVAPVDSGPTVTSIPDQTITSATQPTLVDLWSYFSDPLDGSYLSYTIASDSNTGLFPTDSQPSIDANGFLSLASFASSGTANLTIEATDLAGLSVTSASFTVAAEAPLPQISIIDEASTTKGATDGGFFTLERSGDLTNSLTVEYTLSGADSGDYTDPDGGVVTFAANSLTATTSVPITAIQNGNTSNETLSMSISNSSTYDSTASASITLWGEVGGGVPNVMVVGSHNGDNAGNDAWIRIDRTEDNIADSLTIYVLIDGDLVISPTPTPDGDYDTLQFAANQGTLQLNLTAPTDASLPDIGTVTIEPDQNPSHGTGSGTGSGTASTPHYNRGADYSATVTISDSDDDDDVSLSFLDVTHEVQTSTGVYVPVDNGYDDGSMAAVSETTDGVTYMTPLPVQNNQLDRNLAYHTPNVADLTAATLTVSDADGSSQPGTLTWTVPDEINAWWMEGDRLVPIVSGEAYPFSSGQTVTVYIQGLTGGANTLTASFQPTSGGSAASDGAIVNVFGVNISAAGGPDITVDDGYDLGLTDSQGNLIPDNAPSLVQLPPDALANDPNLQLDTITFTDTMPVGSPYTISVAAGFLVCDPTTGSLLAADTSGTVPASRQVQVLVQCMGPGQGPSDEGYIDLTVETVVNSKPAAANARAKPVDKLLVPNVSVGATINLNYSQPNEFNPSLALQLVRSATDGLKGRVTTLQVDAPPDDGSLKGASGVLVVAQIIGNDINYIIRPWQVELEPGLFLHKITFIAPNTNVFVKNNKNITATIDDTLSVVQHESMHTGGFSTDLIVKAQDALTAENKGNVVPTLVKYLGYAEGAQVSSDIANKQLQSVPTLLAEHKIDLSYAKDLLGSGTLRDAGNIIIGDITVNHARDVILSYGFWHAALTVDNPGTPQAIFNYTYSNLGPLTLTPYKIQLKKP